MDVVMLLARVVLAGVFVVSGVAKLRDREGSRQAVGNFGVPSQLVGPIAASLPFVELLVAIALLPRATGWWAALAGLLLLVAFSTAIAYNLARGRTPDCHCFGQIGGGPIGRDTLVRNAVLGVLAALVLSGGPNDPGRSAIGWMGDLSTAGAVGLVLGVIGLVVLAVEGWLLVHLLGQNGRLLVRLDAVEEALTARGIEIPETEPAEPEVGLAVGSPAPAFRLSGLHGETLTLDALRSGGKPTLVIFTDPTCGPCNALLPDIGRWQREHNTRLTVALLSRGSIEANRAKIAEHGLANVLLQENREVAESYQANGTPGAVIVRPDGTIGSPVALGADAIRALVARTTGAPAPIPVPVPPAPAAAPMRPGAIAVGSPAPTIELPDLDGKTVTLSDFRGQPAVVLFWNPGCGFCQRMVEDVKTWEAGPGSEPDAAKLLIVSTGSVEANKAQGFRSTVVLGEAFATGRDFGASGTPSAVRVDADGNIASGIAVGAPAVLALANGGEAPAGPDNGMPPAPSLTVGDAAPALRVANLDGEQVALKSLLNGTRTLLLFWDPGCGFCSQMLDDLKAWEAKPPKGAPKLLVVSTGAAEVNRAQGLRAPILLDQGFTVGGAFGATGTPSAVLIDGRGRIASEIGVGAQAVLDLAKGGGDRGRRKTVSV